MGSWGTALIWWAQVVGQLIAWAMCIRTSMVCTILQHKPITWPLPGHYTILLVGPSMAMDKCYQKLLRAQANSATQYAGTWNCLVTGESNVMPDPQSICKVSPGLATGISTNTKVNQQLPLVCLPWRTDPIFSYECMPFGGEGHKDERKEVSRRIYVTSRSGDWLVYFQKKMQWVSAALQSPHNLMGHCPAPVLGW